MSAGIVALLYSLVGLLFVGIGIPMALRCVPPNSWYGFRTPKTFSDVSIWYEANRVGGIDLIVGGIVISILAIGLYLIRIYLMPQLRMELWTFGAFVVTMVAVAGHSFWALHRMYSARH